jgi:hypothetical protein
LVVVGRLSRRNGVKPNAQCWEEKNMMETLAGLLTSLTPYLKPTLMFGGGALSLGLLILVLHLVLGVPVRPAGWLGVIAAAVGVLFVAAHVIAKSGGLPTVITLAESADGQAALVAPYLQVGLSLFFPGFLLKLFVGNLLRQ